MSTLDKVKDSGEEIRFTPGHSLTKATGDIHGIIRLVEVCIKRLDDPFDQPGFRSLIRGLGNKTLQDTIEKLVTSKVSKNSGMRYIRTRKFEGPEAGSEAVA